MPVTFWRGFNMKISSLARFVPALALVIGASQIFAQQPQPSAQTAVQRSQLGQVERGQQAPRPTVVRPKDQRVPPPFSMDMARPIAMPDNVWMSELTILEMRDLVKTYGYKTALILNGTMESN